MGRWFPDFEKVINEAFKHKFTCFECNCGTIELTLEEWEEAQEGRMRRKCSTCDKWNSFQFDGATVHNIKGDSELDS